jgi:hypothetical protein
MKHVEKRSRGTPPLHFLTVLQTVVPRGRKGKHHLVVRNILSDLRPLEDGLALRIPLETFGDVKLPNLRAALSRATRAARLNTVTTTDGEYLFIWVEKRDQKAASRKPKAKRKTKVNA